MKQITIAIFRISHELGDKSARLIPKMKFATDLISSIQTNIHGLFNKVCI